MRVLIYRVLACLPLLFVAGCSSVTVGELTGEYTAEFGFAQEHLNLFANGKYRQTITVSGKKEKTVHDGTWEYLQPYSEVVLNAPILVSDLSGRFNSEYQIPATGSWNLTARRWLGQLTLNWDDDAGVQFKKIR